MAVIRVEKNKNYTVMSNYHLRDKRLTWKAKGLMSFMLSLPEDWDYSLTYSHGFSRWEYVNNQSDQINDSVDTEKVTKRAEKTDRDYEIVVRTFQQNIRPVMNEIEIDILHDLVNRYGKELCLEAIVQTVRWGGRSIGYMETVLKHWERDQYGKDTNGSRRKAPVYGQTRKTQRTCNDGSDVDWDNLPAWE